MPSSLRYAALSDVGRVRKDNQDSGYASEHLLVVADGVGGAARGDISSSTAVQILRRLDGPPPDDVLQALAGAIHRAHDRIAELVDEDPELEGTSTTVTVALFDGARMGVGHIGDSRGYLLHDGRLTQLTKDHTFVQGLIDEGRITEEESRTHPHRNLILRAVDGVHETDPDLFFVDVAPGDRVLLCSDGCSGVLDESRLADILGTGTVDYAAVELVRASLDAGSTDNITCVVADIVDVAASADGDSAAAASTGPMLVGAAAEQPRKAGATSKSFFRGHRGGDTGELDPIGAEVADGEIDHAARAHVDPEELRYAPRPPRRFTPLRWLLLLVVLALVVWLAGTLAYKWTQSQYYVAADGPQVAIYKGIPADVPVLTLSSVQETTKVTLASLPKYRAEQVRSGIGADNLDDAHSIVSRLTDLARVCPTPTPTPTPTPSPTRTTKKRRRHEEPVTEPHAGALPDDRPARLHQGDVMNAPRPFLSFTHRRRRGAELFLLVLALIVGIGAYAAVGLGVEGTVPADIVGYGGWLVVLSVGCHIVVRVFAPYADPVLLPIITALNGLGLALIHRIDLANLADNPDAHTFARDQLIWMTLGALLFVAVLVLLRDHRRLQAFTYTAGFAALALLIMPLLPVLGTTINGSRIWINVGPFSFQPGELAKVALVVFFAGYLVLHRDALALAGRRFAGIDFPRGRDLGPVLVMWLVSLAVLVFQRDLGSSLLFFGLFLVMLYVATERPGWLVVGTTLFAAGSYVAFLLFSHVQSRVESWLHPFPSDAASYQIVQGMFGMAWGGLVGRGFGLGDPTLIPFSYSDFIVAALGEELGLTGVMAVIVMYGLIVERGLRTALVCRDAFGKLLATGLAVTFALQVFVVVGGVTRLIPLTGLTTPFLSYGGSSLVANWAIIALLLRISDQARRPLPELSESGDSEATQVVTMR